jgi:rfaE bifunctional protein kinase chain/domain
VKKIEDITILVVGDIMLDKYVVGDVSRISPEAPVPVVKVLKEYATLGGCGNVVRNLAELGVNVHCASSISSDDNGRKIMELLDTIHAQNILTFNSQITTVKERIIADQRQVQMLRIDREVTENIEADDLISEIQLQLRHQKSYDMIVVSDYAKGLITWDLMEFLRSLNTDIIIDPKPQHGDLYGRPLMVTPNKKEWERMDYEDLCKPEFILVTEGKDGMTLLDRRQGFGKSKIPGKPVEVYNVSGAGDTVIAIMATCLSMGMDPVHSANIANECAAYVVTQTGTTVVPKNIFMNIL